MVCVDSTRSGFAYKSHIYNGRYETLGSEMAFSLDVRISNVTQPIGNRSEGLMEHILVNCIRMILFHPLPHHWKWS